MRGQMGAEAGDDRSCAVITEVRSMDRGRSYSEAALDRGRARREENYIYLNILRTRKAWMSSGWNCSGSGRKYIRERSIGRISPGLRDPDTVWTRSSTTSVRG